MLFQRCVAAGSKDSNVALSMIFAAAGAVPMTPGKKSSSILRYLRYIIAVLSLNIPNISELDDLLKLK